MLRSWQVPLQQSPASCRVSRCPACVAWSHRQSLQHASLLHLLPPRQLHQRKQQQTCKQVVLRGQALGCQTMLAAARTTTQPVTRANQAAK
jgi:hypothetical protein